MLIQKGVQLKGAMTSHKKVYLTLTCACNNSCLSCCITDELRESGVKLTFNEIKEYLSHIEVRPEDIVEVSGGEPTRHAEFLEIMKYLRQTYPCEIALLTNSESFSDSSLISATFGLFDHVVTTIYSTDSSVHDYITRTVGSFQRKVQGLKNLNRNGVKLHIKTIPMKPTMNDIPSFVDFCGDNFSVPHLIINMVDVVGNALKNHSTMIAENLETVPLVEQGIDKAIARGLSLSVFMPMCLIDPCYWDFFPVGFGQVIGNSIFISPTRGMGKVQTQLLRKPSICVECVLQERCFWPWENYMSIYGDREIQPVTATT